MIYMRYFPFQRMSVINIFNKIFKSLLFISHEIFSWLQNLVIYQKLAWLILGIYFHEMAGIKIIFAKCSLAREPLLLWQTKNLKVRRHLKEWTNDNLQIKWIPRNGFRF